MILLWERISDVNIDLFSVILKFIACKLAFLSLQLKKVLRKSWNTNLSLELTLGIRFLLCDLNLKHY